MIDEPPTKYGIRTETVIATLLALFQTQANRPACDILENAKARIEVTGYDNWDGGQNIYTLFLDLPMTVFAKIETDVSKIENLISHKLKMVLPPQEHQSLQEVSIRPMLEEPTASFIPNAAPVDVEYLWAPGMLRVFLSHVSKHKVAVSKLKRELSKYGVSCFVAHEDIEPTLEWQNEIELALRSMHALVALLTPEFHESKWTDQEVGFALGHGTFVITVRLGLDPYGFIGKMQGLPGDLDSVAPLASSIVDLLLKRKNTADKMREALIVGLETSSSFEAVKVATKKISGLRSISVAQLSRLETASKKNNQVANSFGVPERIQQIVQRFKPKMPDEVSF